MARGKTASIYPTIVIGRKIYDAAEISLILNELENADLRRAIASDIDALCTLENQCFPSNLYGEHVLSRQQFSHLIKRANSLLMVYRKNAQVCGYALLLFNSRSHTARLYSIAVSPLFQGQGIGRFLLETVEHVCTRLPCARLTLEIRADNKPALQKYIRLGYKIEKISEDYFPQHMAAIKLSVSVRNVLAIRYPDVEKKACE